MADLVITGIGLPPASIRGVKQTLAPIGSASKMARTVNGALVDISASQFRKYSSSISCSDQQPPELTGVWPGALVTVDCIVELVATAAEVLERAAVETRTEDGFVFYRPRLTMRVISYNLDKDEWGAVVGWSLELEEQ